MATQAEAAAHGALVDDVATLAVAQLVTEWADLPTDAPATLGKPLGDLLTTLVGDFSLMTATLGAEWYEQLRDDAGIGGSYTAVLADVVPDEQIRSSASWAASGAFIDEQKALRDAAAVLDRLVADRDRASIEVNVARDPAAPRYARYASANACAFCAMNALRGPVYRSEESAAGKYHAHCRCVAVPVWRPGDYTEAPYVADWREAYHSATDTLGGAHDTKAILAHMRQTAGLR